MSVVDAMEIGLSESDSSPLPPPFPPGGAGGSLPFTAALVVEILLLLTIFYFPAVTHSTVYHFNFTYRLKFRNVHV